MQKNSGKNAAPVELFMESHQAFPRLTFPKSDPLFKASRQLIYALAANERSTVFTGA
jgi:hypothetical protein